MHQRKRRKWDVGGPGMGGTDATPQPPTPNAAPPSIRGNPVARAGQPPDAETIKRAQKAALAVVSKLNRESMAKGLIPAGRVDAVGGGLGGGQASAEKKEASRDVTINDAPPQVRYILTRRGTQEDIQRQTGTVIVTRGKYCPSGAVRSDDRDKPLHLRIFPGAGAGESDASKERAVEAAVQMVERFLRGGRSSCGDGGGGGGGCSPSSSSGHHRVPPPPSQVALPVLDPKGAGGDGFDERLNGRALNPPSSSSLTPAQLQHAKVFVNINPPSGFDLASKLQGPEGSYFKHIKSETGSIVELRGQGSGADEGQEPMHILVTCPSRDGLEDARSLAEHLVGTVKSEYYRQYPVASTSSSLPLPQPLPSSSHCSGARPPACHARPPYTPYGQLPAQPDGYFNLYSYSCSPPSQQSVLPYSYPTTINTVRPSSAQQAYRTSVYANQGLYSSSVSGQPGMYWQYGSSTSYQPSSSASTIQTAPAVPNNDGAERPGKRGRFNECKDSTSAPMVSSGSAGAVSKDASLPDPATSPAGKSVADCTVRSGAAIATNQPPLHRGLITGFSNSSAGDSGTRVALVDYDEDD